MESVSVSECCQLIGHKKDVVCLDVSEFDDNVLCSGSEDVTVRIWDIRSRRASKCLLSCFEGGDCVDTVAFSKINGNIVYASCGSNLFTFDTRKEGVLIKEAESKYVVDDDNNIEIQSLSLQSKGEFIAVGDDIGIISIIPLDNKHLPTNELSNGIKSKKLSRFHCNMIGSIAFRPNSNREIISGGFDCNLFSWDFISSRPQASYNYSTEIENTLKNSDHTSQTNILNPPFIQCVRFGIENRAVVSALGNGSVRICFISTYHKYDVIGVNVDRRSFCEGFETA